MCVCIYIKKSSQTDGCALLTTRSVLSDIRSLCTVINVTAHHHVLPGADSVGTNITTLHQQSIQDTQILQSLLVQIIYRYIHILYP